ncbi:single-stranded DNA-binding protein [Nostoc minutum NIES-26]|uniref:Single-stranded DNA-binding protein n=1 Tax=Nostoc minutum NIES-26 TaxID=1844469 RepID=A0A367RZR1_9NOSO|nr:single-stranded DNA-binding protein [Dendronalium sp. ChiSLP03b]MDZ8207220.1 single-stranded DNA-binding protein [Dendronalium sp. ChiSLP03b]RCJ40692.1 single-stranded DNA-binding protein [Nostoc minutum NIES-26]
MNSCVLMAEIVQEPQLRYTSDNLAVTEMLVQFPNSQKQEDQPATLKVVGWGNLATEIQQNYHQGDRVILVGRLGMHTVERQEGFKEKRAELTVQQIQSLTGDFHTTSSRNTSVAETPARQSSPGVSSPVAASQDVPSYESSRPAATPTKTTVGVVPQVTPEPIPQASNFDLATYPTPVEEEPDPDDIPF